MYMYAYMSVYMYVYIKLFSFARLGKSVHPGSLERLERVRYQSAPIHLGV